MRSLDETIDERLGRPTRLGARDCDPRTHSHVWNPLAPPSGANTALRPLEIGHHAARRYDSYGLRALLPAPTTVNRLGRVLRESRVVAAQEDRVLRGGNDPREGAGRTNATPSGPLQRSGAVERHVDVRVKRVAGRTARRPGARVQRG